MASTEAPIDGVSYPIKLGATLTMATSTTSSTSSISTLPTSPTTSLPSSVRSGVIQFDTCIPVVIKCMIISYVSFRSYLSMKRLNKQWHGIAERSESKSSHLLRVSSFLIKCHEPHLLDNISEWLQRLVSHAPTILSVPTIPCATSVSVNPKLESSLILMGDTLTSLSIDSLLEVKDPLLLTSSGILWCKNLTSLSLPSTFPATLFKQLPRLAHYRGVMDASCIPMLPSSLTSLTITGLIPSDLIQVLDNHPSLTHLYADGLGPLVHFSDDQRRRIITHPSLTSIGGPVWGIPVSTLTTLVHDIGLSQLKCIEVLFVKTGFTKTMMTLAPNLTNIQYQLWADDIDEIKSLSMMKSLVHLKLIVREVVVIPSLPLVSHVLKDLVIQGPFDDDNPMPSFELFRRLTQLTSLTIVANSMFERPTVSCFDSFATIGMPLLLAITMIGDLPEAEEEGEKEEPHGWKHFLRTIPNCNNDTTRPHSDRRLYFASNYIARMWIEYRGLEQSCARVVPNGIYPCHPISLLPIDYSDTIDCNPNLCD
jgi:hypothetical protein